MMTPEIRLGGTRTSHRWAELPGNWDRLNTRALFPSSNEWGIPDLPAAPEEWTPAQLLPYSNRYACDTSREGDAVHFFLDDYRFEAVWSKPVRALSRLKSVGTALTPDFSMWRDMPTVMQIWQTYRARWCGAWMLHHGIRVIPTIGWSTPDSYPFAFAGVARGSLVAVSTVGTRQDPQARELFTLGYIEMLEQIRPCRVLVYGSTEGCSVGDVEIREYPARRVDA